MPTKESIFPLLKKYIEEDPARAATNLTTLSETHAADVLNNLSVSASYDVFSRIPSAYAALLVDKISKERLQEILQKLDPQKGSEVFLNLSETSRQQFVESLPDTLKQKIQELLSFPEGSAGRMMKADFLAFRLETTVKETINRLRHLVKKNTQISYVYVVDGENHLQGVINMRDLMLSSQEAPLSHVMRKDVFSINSFTDREQVAQELSKRKFFSVPVVDNENRILGVVKAESLLATAQEEATEDIQKMFGAGGDERTFSPISFSLKKRLPWLHVNLVTAFMAAGVVALFEGIIAKMTVLAVYLPVVAGQGGNAGAQSLAVVMRGLVMREIPKGKAKKLILKETWIGMVNGFVIGIVTALIAWAWQGNPFLGVVIGLGMLVNLSIAGLSGASIPIAMKAIGLDPAQCSNIILTTVTDVMGFFAFLGFAVLFQSYLI
ncbi:magnesium transporter [bacterium F11]|nr:magnesium transporter [bacterium F11]